jgi:hypothetical protein
MESFIGGKRVVKIFGCSFSFSCILLFAKFFWVKPYVAYFFLDDFFNPANLSFGQIFPVFFCKNFRNKTSKHFWQTRWALYTNGAMMLFWCSWIITGSGNLSLKLRAWNLRHSYNIQQMSIVMVKKLYRDSLVPPVGELRDVTPVLEAALSRRTLGRPSSIGTASTTCGGSPRRRFCGTSCRRRAAW